VKLATPSAVMVCLEYWAFELLVLIAGLLPNSTVSTSLIAMWYVSRLDQIQMSACRGSSLNELTT
jgi:hypothetical protein